MNNMVTYPNRDARAFGYAFSVYRKGQWKKLKPEIKYAFVKEFILTQDLLNLGWINEDSIFYTIYFDGKEKSWLNLKVVGSFQYFHNGDSVVVVRRKRATLPAHIDKNFIKEGSLA
jgi:hypothetical protein